VKKSNEPFKFAELFPLRDPIAEMPPLEDYQARDGATQSFRRYSCESEVHAILIHGSSSHSAYLHAFAKYLSLNNVANVYAVDLRGHGPSPRRRGDIDYVNQLEDDIADLIGYIKNQPLNVEKFIVGSHSSGGGMALRFGGGKYGHLAQGILLLAPYLAHKAPMVKRNAGGWASANIPKIIGLSILDGMGIRIFNSTKVLKFNLPQRYHTGYETLEYSFRLMIGMHPVSYQTSLIKTKAKLLIIVGTDDETSHANEFEAGVLPYKADAQVSLVEGVAHLGIIMSESAMCKTAQWINEIDV
jgi:non-heme chloroperoxidase